MKDDADADDVQGDEAEAQVQFWPMRTTAARSLRVGDQLRIPTGPHTGHRALITEIHEDEASRTLTITGKLLGADEGVLFKKQAYPNELFERLGQPGEPPQRAESRMVHAEELWKWLGVDMNDPEGSAEKFVLKTFRRFHSDETDSEAIELGLQSKQNPLTVRILHMKPKGTVGLRATVKSSVRLGANHGSSRWRSVTSARRPLHMRLRAVD